MALDFPASPTVGQKYPSPAVTGVPVYTWDGEKWTTLGGAIGSTGASDAIPAPDTTAGAAGSSTLWARGDHSHPALAAPYVRYDATQTLTTPQQQQATTNIVAVSGNPQSLTVPQQQQARQNIYAPPFDAMAYSGLQINGAMEVSQELGASGVTVPNGTAKYVIDGWVVGSSGVQSTTGITGTLAPPSYTKSLQVAVPTANASPAAGDFCYVGQLIEGYRVAKLNWGTANAQPITLAFWVFASRTGLYGGAISNGAGNRSYPFTFTVNAISTWEYKTIIIPGDTTGTWAKDNTSGMAVRFSLMAGSSFSGAAGVWAGSLYFSATGCINGIAANTDTLLVTGVTVIPGNEAPSAARSPFVMRSYDQELVTCKRYFEIQRGTHTHYVNGAGSWGGDPVSFKTEKRANPTVAPLNATGANCSGPTIGSISQWGFNWSVSIISAGGAFISFDWNADARL